MLMLPVSIGEAIDKLTILDIKIEKIKDSERNHHCKIEYDILYEQLKDIVNEHKFYYDQLKHINLSIWDMQDDIRSSDNPITQTCLDILNMNDSRFRIKDIINRKANSILREQKGYATKKALFLGHQGLGDHINYVGAVRYLSLLYDEFVVACVHQHNLENVKSFYADNPNIQVVKMSRDYRPWDETLLDKEMNLKQYSMVYRIGAYKEGGFPPGPIPDDWYHQLGIDPKIRLSHFSVPETLESKNLYESIQVPYIFTQQKSSDSITNLVTWDINEILTIDPNLNLYSADHVWYDLAQSFINKPFYYYYDTIRHAKEIYTVDSAFYCIAIHLKLDADIRNCYNRDGTLNDEYTKLFNI